MCEKSRVFRRLGGLAAPRKLRLWLQHILYFIFPTIYGEQSYVYYSLCYV